MSTSTNDGGRDLVHEGPESVHESASPRTHDCHDTYQSRPENCWSNADNKAEESVNEDWVGVGEDEDGEFYKNLNSIILQYFENSGLDQSYRTFYDECQTLGYVIPENWASEPESSHQIDCNDADTLLKHFDEENGESLLEVWNSVMQTGIGRNADLFKISVFIHIYVALIPFRQNLPNEQKVIAMQRLRDYFQSKTDDCTNDEEVLKYFALPFVQDPQSHPIFSKLLTDSWIDEVRTRLQTTVGSKKQVLDPLETDLAQLFLSWSESVQHSVELEHGQSWTLQTTPHPVTLTSSANFNIKSLNADNPLRKFFENIHELTEENRHLKNKETESEYKYSHLLNFCAVLVGYLVEACKGKSVDMIQLKSSICEVFPQMVHSNELRTCEDKQSNHVNERETPRASLKMDENRSGRIKSTKGKRTRPKENHMQSNIHPLKQSPQRRNVFTTQETEANMKNYDEKELPGHQKPVKIQDAFLEDETNIVTTQSIQPQQVQPKIRSATSCCENGIKCNHKNASPRSITALDGFPNRSTDKIIGSARINQRSSRIVTHVRGHSPECKSISYRCDIISARGKSQQTPRGSRKSTEIGGEAHSIVGRSYRPRTYEMNPEQEGDNLRTSFLNEDGSSSRQSPSCNKDKPPICQRGDASRGTNGRQTYRVRVVEASGSKNNSPKASTSPVKTFKTPYSPERNDRFPDSTETSGRSQKSLSRYSAEKNVSARTSFSGTPRDTETYTSGCPFNSISTTTTDDNKVMIYNSNASWKTVSHTADNIAINGNSVNNDNERQNCTPRLQLLHLHPRRSLSETNLRKIN